MIISDNLKAHALNIPDLPNSGDSIGLAADTVDKYSQFILNQTTFNNNVNLPTPTDQNVIHIIFVHNIGSAIFNMGARDIGTGESCCYAWVPGDAWQPLVGDNPYSEFMEYLFLDDPNTPYPVQFFGRHFQFIGTVPFTVILPPAGVGTQRVLSFARFPNCTVPVTLQCAPGEFIEEVGNSAINLSSTMLPLTGYGSHSTYLNTNGFWSLLSG